MISRRAFASGVVFAAALGGWRAARGAGSPPTLRLGAMANLTHAPMLAGLGSGRIAAALAPYAVEPRIFRAGPRVTEALLGRAIEAGTAGPAAVVVHHARHARGLRILTGCSSGGASLVVRAGIAGASDLAGRRLAVTQIATTQDVALRTYLRNAGLRETTRGGNVTVLAIAGATILEQMRRGDLDGAWLPEPWATRIVLELHAVRLVDERDLWPERRFASAVLTARAEDATTPWSTRLTGALDEEVRRAQADRSTALREAHTMLRAHVGNPGALALFEKSADFVDFTSDPLRASVERFGEDAASFGFCPPHPAAGLFA